MDKICWDCAEDDIREHIENIIGGYCDCTWDGLENARFVEWHTSPQECSDRVVAYIMERLKGLVEELGVP